MTRRAGITTLALIATLALAGCTSNGASSGDSAPIPETGDFSVESAEGATSSMTDDTALGAVRSVISTATLSLTVEDPIEAADDAVALVIRASGRVDSRSESPAVDNRGRSANLVVRVPATGLSEFLAAVKDLGENELETITATDVTAQAQDLDARISALSTSVDRLTTLLATATDTSDLIEIETALSTRQADLESMQAQQRSLADQVALATVSIDLGTVETAPVDEPQNFFGGIVTGWEALVAFLGAIAIATGVALPWLIVPLVIAIVVALVLRRRRAASRRVAAVTVASAAASDTPRVSGAQVASETPAPTTMEE